MSEIKKTEEEIKNDKLNEKNKNFMNISYAAGSCLSFSAILLLFFFKFPNKKIKYSSLFFLICGILLTISAFAYKSIQIN